MARFLTMSISKKRSKVKSSKSNPKIKNKPLSKAKRSRAAKKGWATRRAKQGKEARLNEKVKKWKNIRPDFLEIPEIEKILNLPGGRALLKAIAKVEAAKVKKARQGKVSLEVKKALKHFEVDYVDIDSYLDTFVDTDESIIINRMAAAQEAGRLDDEAKILAEEFNWPVQEIYTLFMSP